MLFRDLSPSAKIVYHVTRRIKNHKTNSFFHAIETIADLAGISESSARRGLQSLVDMKILKAQTRSGTSTEYTFIDNANLSRSKPNLTPLPIQIDTPGVSNLHPNNSSLTDSDLTTTGIDLKFYQDMVIQYGKEAVDVVVENVKKMNGSVKNPGGYVRSALKHGYIPTNAEIRAREKAKERAKQIDEEREKSLAEWEERKKEREKSQLTPDEIKKMIEKIGN